MSMIKTEKKFHTERFLLDIENLKELYTFVKSYSSECIIEIISFTRKGNTTREFLTFEDFLALKQTIKEKISKLTIRGYIEKKELITLEFNNSINKLFLFFDPFTLKSKLGIMCADESEVEFERFMTEYNKKIKSIIFHERDKNRIGESIPSIILASLFTYGYLAPYTTKNIEIFTLSAVSIFTWLLFNIVFNMICYPIIYTLRPLVYYQFDKKNKVNLFYSYLSTIKNYFRENKVALLNALIPALIASIIALVIE